MTHVEVLLKLLGLCARTVREIPAGSNAGPKVEAIQRWSDGQRGDSWCAFLVAFVGELSSGVMETQWPLPRTGSCEMVRQYAVRHRLTVQTPSIGDVYLLLNDQGKAHHTGFVVGVGLQTFDEISGNTTDPTKAPSINGWGCFRHTRTFDPHRYTFVHWQT